MEILKMNSYEPIPKSDLQMLINKVWMAELKWDR